MAGELLKMRLNAFMVHIPYRGGGPAVMATMAGDVPLLIVSISAVMSGGGEHRPSSPGLPYTDRTRTRSCQAACCRGNRRTKIGGRSLRYAVLRPQDAVRCRMHAETIRSAAARRRHRGHHRRTSTAIGNMHHEALRRILSSIAAI